ncbi:MAG TPA: cation diffusion facilitator family transporter [Candidatus Eisenbacteria bacterium]|nr:cation diffusion facilitator family transporter [Candidatus Eisenbacteria bacterium]
MSGAKLMSHPHSSAHYGNKDAIRAVVVSAVALGLAAVAEISASILSGSASVLADGLHNAGDVMTSFILLFTFALVRRPATRRFSSGYGRFEDVATLLIVVVIIITAAIAAAESVTKLLHPVTYSNIPLSLAAALIGVVANLGVSEYKVRVGRGIGSESLEADGIHSRIDALVSAGAFAGIGLAGLGLTIADPILGILITVAIVFALAGTVKQLYYRMMDAVDPTIIDELTSSATAVPGVLAVHDVRVRWVGRELVAVMHVDMDPKSTLENAHAIAMRVEDAVCHEVPAARLEIHMDPGTTPHTHTHVGTPPEESEDEEDDQGHGHNHEHY